MRRAIRTGPSWLVIVLAFVALVGLCANAAHALNFYVDYNVYDDTSGSSGAYIYTYEIFADTVGQQTLSQWWLEVGGCPDIAEAPWSPTPTGTLPYLGDWSNASGYTQGYSWQKGVIDTNPPVRSVRWDILWSMSADQDNDGVGEGYEPGVDNGYLSGYSGTHPPGAPHGVNNTDVAIGWFVIRSTRPPMNRDFTIQDGTAQWTGTVKGPTPEPVTMALLALGLPLGILARRRRKED